MIYSTYSFVTSSTLPAAGLQPAQASGVCARTLRNGSTSPRSRRDSRGPGAGGGGCSAARASGATRSSIASCGSAPARRAGSSRVIVRLHPGVSADAADAAIRGLRGTLGRRLPSVGGQVAYVPDTALAALARLPGVNGVSLDRRVQGTLERTGATVGATWVRDTLGFDGTGVGIAIIDSGVANWHDDLGSGRVTRFVDFVNFQPPPTTTTATARTSPASSRATATIPAGRRRGVAPGATLLVEKVLDASGQGYISNVIAAIDYAIANKDALNIRVINLSVAAGVYESYTTDPLTLAAKRAVEAGIVVVSAAGNLGRDAERQAAVRRHRRARATRRGCITVGASSHNGTVDRVRRHRRAASARAARPRSTSRPSPTSSRPASASSRSPKRAARSGTPSR